MRAEQPAAGQSARDPAPPYAGEGEFALWHFSEDPDLLEFQPRAPRASPDSAALVWAVDTRHAPLFWFPRECPRGCIWPVPATTSRDLERFSGEHCLQWPACDEEDADRELQEEGNQVDLCQCFRP